MERSPPEIASQIDQSTATFTNSTIESLKNTKTQNAETNKVLLYWDYENIPFPSTSDPKLILKRINDKIRPQGTILSKKVYSQSFSNSVLDAFGLYGFDTIQVSSGKPEACDKRLIIDCLCDIISFETQRKNLTICLVSLDTDFSPLLHKLQDLGIKVIHCFSKILLRDKTKSLFDGANKSYEVAQDTTRSIETISSYSQMENGRNLKINLSHMQTTPSKTLSGNSPPKNTTYIDRGDNKKAIENRFSKLNQSVPTFQDNRLEKIKFEIFWKILSTTDCPDKALIESWISKELSINLNLTPQDLTSFLRIHPSSNLKN